MITITFVNPKGGTGKTTSCLILAEQLAEAGYKVGVLDCDPNRNILGWQEQRERKAATKLFDVIAGPSEDDLIDKLAELESIYEVLLLDMEGTADQIVTFALSQTDLCIIPFEPTPMETRQAARSVSLVSRTSKMINRPIKFVLVMTRTNAAFQTSDEKDVRSSIRDMPILDTSLVKRAAFTRIFRDAELLKELDPGSVSNVAKAIENARLFANDVIKHLREENPE
ncbi:ParA family protein [Tritonibacter mobilis]|uniref:ParA family protein n=1 Tax=Tritonibacter mobilis TaxID=379347 RepID=UPI000806A0B7|nr:ParA family protein [Tritonibacter mobilis]